jgi:hypothetical protein
MSRMAFVIYTFEIQRRALANFQASRHFMSWDVHSRRNPPPCGVVG